MQESFWQARWSEGRIGFHEPAANPLLTRFLPQLTLTPADHVFVPLCGKSFDLDWLLSQGLRVTGIEFNQAAVEEVFDRLSLPPQITETGALTRYQAGDLTLYCGDVFALTANDLGPVTAIYDRAALVALPPETRPLYAAHLIKITQSAPQLLIGFDYDQTLTDGPPFSTPQDEISQHYADRYAITELLSQPITGPLGARTQGMEQAWLLTPT
ncbi:thiopurine S-methyltransferase [Tropicibacter sp. R15_0]|uniref:thiopurine S-methyltransferase n=1 Tax=Tropicibacter sp. R15_0 TaxID=2821101 RepID=UPI001ADB6008|nr:thiopurine S-methyltransferase [Tropicibacter sp. R15_0]MBO9464357.1 thiopurine S-methyltransferase [Tropicibacter sp. R15_0]